MGRYELEERNSLSDWGSDLQGHHTHHSTGEEQNTLNHNVQWSVMIQTLVKASSYLVGWVLGGTLSFVRVRASRWFVRFSCLGSFPIQTWNQTLRHFCTDLNVSHGRSNSTINKLNLELFLAVIPR